MAPQNEIFVYCLPETLLKQQPDMFVFGIIAATKFAVLGFGTDEHGST
jgi:hypothetical protein